MITVAVLKTHQLKVELVDKRKKKRKEEREDVDISEVNEPGDKKDRLSNCRSIAKILKSVY